MFFDMPTQWHASPPWLTDRKRANLIPGKDKACLQLAAICDNDIMSSKFLDRAMSRLKKRRCKVIATLGPASASPETVSALLSAGVNVFRMNMSHGDHAGHAEVYRLVRDLSKQYGGHIAVFADLCGPKIRVGRFEGGSIQLVPDTRVTISPEYEVGEDGRIPSLYPHIARDLTLGSRILLDDGNLELKVCEIRDQVVTADVIVGGTLKDRKGMNLPDSQLTARAPTDKDLTDARFAIELGVDFLALSFVRSAQDLRDLRSQLGDAAVPIIAKIEMPEALEAIDEIAIEADGLMVARGDLGVELAPEDVPIVQDRLVDLGRLHDKPVIVATQMLDSMIRNPRPTRAEVTDISHAVWRGADAVMLSGETAAGAYPVEAVQMMDKVARRTEGYMWNQGHFGHITRLDHLDSPLSVEDSFAKATASMSRDLRVRAIVVVSRTGRSASVVSAARPAAPILAISDSDVVCRRMNLMWGVFPVLGATSTQPIAMARDLIEREQLAKPGDHFLLVRGFSSDPQKDAPTVTILQV